ncbi:MAG: hypothetical protein M3116_04960, partial [Actinomycetota bacterium]|nr:hypothetical protein [Actinomycetota bacterium]
MTTARAAGSPPRTTNEWVRLADGMRPGPAHRRPPTARRVLTQFIVGNLLAVTVVIAGTVWISGRAALDESLADARSAASLLVRGVVQPELPADIASAPDPRTVEDFGRFDEDMRDAIAGARLVRMKIWTRAGRIVYSDETRLINATFPLGDDELAVLDNGGVESELSDLKGRENFYERRFDSRLLEVYRPVETQDGERLLFETYSRYDDATDRQRNILLTFAPISAAALLVLMLLQLPLGLRMMRQLRDGERERVALLARAADASIDERRRVAASLHDGIVQDLSAASLVMTGAVEGGRVRDETA